MVLRSVIARLELRMFIFCKVLMTTRNVLSIDVARSPIKNKLGTHLKTHHKRSPEYMIEWDVRVRHV